MIKVDGLPSSLRVGPYDITIAIVDELTGSYGEFSPVEQEIRLLREYKTAALAVDTLLHEVLHAAWFAAALPKKYEERTVSALAPTLTQILRDHPEVLEWVRKALGASDCASLPQA